MAVSLPSPGVRVTQVFRSVSPTIITPTLPACVVGVCKQIVDVVKTSSGSSSLNTDAIITLPAFFIALPATGSPPVYAGLDALSLVLSINNGPSVTVLFDGGGSNELTPASVVAQINAAFLASGVTEALAETVGTDSFRIRSIGVGDFQTLHIVGGVGGTDGAVAAAFGLVEEYLYPGRATYDQFDFIVPPSNMPDPRHNLTELSIEWSTVRVFLALGNGTDLFEVKRTQSFLRNGGLASEAVMTGSIDLSTLTFSTAAVHTGSANVTAGGLYGGGGTLATLTLTMTVNGGSPATLTFVGAGNAVNQAAMLAAIHSTWPAITATVVGTNLKLTDSLLGTPSTFTINPASTSLVALGLTAATYVGVNGTLTTQTLVLSVDGGGSQTVTFSYPANQAAILTAINAIVNPDLVATQNLSLDLVLTTLSVSNTASVKVVSGAAAALLGLTVGQTVYGINGVAAIDDGNGDALTPLVQMNGEDFTAAASIATMIGSVDVTALVYPSGVQDKTLVLSDGHTAQTLVLDTIADETALAAAIEAFWPNFVVDVSATFLRIRTTATGAEAVVSVIGGTAVTTLGLTVSKAHGAPFPPISGDELWVDGVFLGRITQVAPGGVVDVLKIDKQVPINPALGASFYVIAKNLTGTATVTRPSSDLILDLQNNVSIKHEILRDTTGTPIATGRAQVYISYHAVRKDVTSSARDPGLLRFEATTDLAAQLEPVTSDNPLALGMYFALLNAPGNQVMGLGVDEISASEPYGTVEGFTRAAEYLEAFEVYGIAPLTHNQTVGQVFMAHVDTMSGPDFKGERICVFNSAQPSTKLDTLVTSGLNGNSASSLTFDTGVQNLAQLLLGAGVSPIGTIPVSAGLFLDIASDDQHYSITSISGSVLTIKVSGFQAGENDDSFYAVTNLATPPLPTILIEEPFAVRVRGASLVLTDGVTPDRAGIAETYQQLGASYGDRRFWHVVPDKCAATIDGFEQTLEGFYMCAAIVGAVGKQKPDQSFTNFPLVGFTRVIGTTDFFTQRQLGVIMAGGNWVMIQPAPGGPLLSKFALTTNMTSVETKTDSITKIVDFVAKFVRNGLRNFIGRFNINQGFLDTLGHVLQGLLSFLQDQGTLNGFTVKRIIQDESNPDTVLIDIQLDVPFPCNFIDVTLVI